MVNSGKPSKGCQTCRSRRVKCDEVRPVCSQCIKSKRRCHGYRSLNDLVFRDETSSTKFKVNRISISKPIFKSSSLKVILGGDSAEPFTDCRQIERVELPPNSNPICKSIPQYPEQLALSYFFTAYVLVPRHSEVSHGFLECLLPLYRKAKADSALSAATSALALATLNTNSGREYLRLDAQHQYGKAISKIQKAISDPILAKSDLTLVSVLLFGLFECMTCTLDTLGSWGKHIDGAVALLKLRGREDFESPISRTPFFAVRSQMVMNHISSCKPIEPLLGITEDWANLPEQLADNVANRLTVMSLRLPTIRATSIRILGLEKIEKNRQMILDLMKDTKSVDQDIAAWPPEASKTWSHRAYAICKGIVEIPEREELHPGRIDEYYDVWVASIWNVYRTCRIFAQTIILNCLEWLEIDSPYENETQRCKALQVIQTMVDEICASVPFHLGVHVFERKDVCLITPENGPLKQDPFGKGRSTQALGGFFLIWPLFVARSAVSAPEMQRKWINGRLSWIGKRHGLNQAKILSKLGPHMARREYGKMQSISDFTPPTTLDSEECYN